MVICPWQTGGVEAPSDIPSQAPAQSLAVPSPGQKTGVTRVRLECLMDQEWLCLEIEGCPLFIQRFIASHIYIYIY